MKEIKTLSTEGGRGIRGESEPCFTRKPITNLMFNVDELRNNGRS